MRCNQQQQDNSRLNQNTCAGLYHLGHIEPYIQTKLQNVAHEIVKVQYPFIVICFAFSHKDI